MKISLSQWLKKNITLLTNTASLIGTTAVTSALGFAYWWLAARQFTLDAVGLASASVSAMMLLGNLFALGLGTLLITELPRQPGQAPSLISTALIVVGGTGCIGGIGFAVLVPYLSPGLQPLHASVITVLIFAAGVSLTAITLVLDQALIGLLRGDVQLWRNTSFSALKLCFLFLASLWIATRTGISIYTTWTLGNLLSLLMTIAYIKFNTYPSLRVFLPQWQMIRKLGRAALQHHALNITLQIPTFLLPLLVTALLSTTMNAWFYVSWMLASFVFMIPISLTTVLHAMSSAHPSSLAQKIRTTMGISFVISLAADVFLEVAAQPVLEIFGHSYAQHAVWCLRILVLAAFPLIIKNHYISICRIHDHITQAFFIMIPGGVIELVAAGLGAFYGGIAGVSVGWVVGISIEALFMGPVVYKAIRPQEKVLLNQSVDEAYFMMEPIWNMNTLPLPSIEIVALSGQTLYNNSSKGQYDLRPAHLQNNTYDRSMEDTINIESNNMYDHLETQDLSLLGTVETSYVEVDTVKLGMLHTLRRPDVMDIVLFLLPFLALFLWLTSMQRVTLNEMNDLGLISVLSPNIIAALVILVVSYTLTLRRKDLRV